MITVGIIRELEFMAKAVDSDVYVVMRIANKNISMKIWDNSVIISYEGRKIWEENIYGEANWFGIESCDSIARIISCIDKGESWQESYGWNKSDNKVHVPLDEAIGEVAKDE